MKELMHTNPSCAVCPRHIEQCARVKWTCKGHACIVNVPAPRQRGRPRQRPPCRRPCAVHRIEGCNAAVVCKLQANVGQRRAVVRNGGVGDGRATVKVHARPTPVAKTVRDRFDTEVAIVVRAAAIRHIGPFKVHLNLCMWLHRPPCMAATSIELHGHGQPRARPLQAQVPAHGPAKPRWQGVPCQRDRIFVDRPLRAVHAQSIGCARDITRMKLSEHKAAITWPREHKIETDKLMCVCVHAPCTCARKRRREHIAHQDNGRQRMLAVFAVRVDVPPGIARGRERDIKRQSSKYACAAKCPLCATMGTPAPGCVEPPHR